MVAAILISAAVDLPAGPFLVVCFAVSATATRLLCRGAGGPQGPHRPTGCVIGLRDGDPRRGGPGRIAAGA